MKAASGGVSAAGEVVEIGDVRVLTRKVDDLDAAALRDLADSLKGTLAAAWWCSAPPPTTRCSS